MKLTNGDIFMAREPLAKLMEQKFPVKVSYNLAKMANKLNEQLKVIDEVRNGLIKTYGDADPDNPQQLTVKQEVEKTDDKGKIVTGKDKNPIMEPNPKFSTFMGEFAELMNKEEEIDFSKTEVPVKLPEKVAATCDSCHHNMDKSLEIEPNILLTLEKFIEVE